MMLTQAELSGKGVRQVSECCWQDASVCLELTRPEDAVRATLAKLHPSCRIREFAVRYLGGAPEEYPAGDYYVKVAFIPQQDGIHGQASVAHTEADIRDGRIILTVGFVLDTATSTTT